MTSVKITNQVILEFQTNLKNEEKSGLTIKKYAYRL